MNIVTVHYRTVVVCTIALILSLFMALIFVPITIATGVTTHIYLVRKQEVIGGHWHVNGSTITSMMGTKIVRSWFAWHCT